MKTKNLSLGVCALMLGWLTACQPKNVPEPAPQDDPAADTTATDEPEVQLPSAFPKKHLIEEFTIVYTSLLITIQTGWLCCTTTVIARITSLWQAARA